MSEFKRVIDPAVIAFWMKECDRRSGQEYLDDARIMEYAAYIANSPFHHCFASSDAFCGFTVEAWPYRFCLGTPFCIVAKGFEGFLGVMNAIEKEGNKLGVERWRLQAKDERFAKLLKRRYRHTVEGCAILMVEGRS